MPTPPRPTPIIVAQADATMDVRIVRRVPMLYASGANPSIDRPAHVRAGSGLAWVGSRLAVVQDDANFIALVDVRTGVSDGIALPAGHGSLRQFDDSRGNKAFKNDFESLVSIVHRDESRLMAFGSGSTSMREKIAIVDALETAAPFIRVIDAHSFYEALRANRDFSGSELNIEGVASVGHELRFFNRGNGAAREAVLPVNASCDVNLAELLCFLEDTNANSAPNPRNTLQYDLGEIGGTRLSFTDAVSLHPSSVSDPAASRTSEGAAISTREPRILYSAAAEASPDVVRDGEVRGSAIGIYSSAAGVAQIRWAPVRSDDGAIANVKVEGVAVGTRPGQLYVVVDSDDHDQPSELYELSVPATLTER